MKTYKQLKEELVLKEDGEDESDKLDRAFHKKVLLLKVKLEKDYRSILKKAKTEEDREHIKFRMSTHGMTEK